MSAQFQQGCESEPFLAPPHPQVRIPPFSCLQIQLPRSQIESHARQSFPPAGSRTLLFSLENNATGSAIALRVSVSWLPGLVTCGDEPPTWPLPLLPSDLPFGRRLAWAVKTAVGSPRTCPCSRWSGWPVSFIPLLPTWAPLAAWTPLGLSWLLLSLRGCQLLTWGWGGEELKSPSWQWRHFWLHFLLKKWQSEKLPQTGSAPPLLLWVLLVICDGSLVGTLSVAQSSVLCWSRWWPLKNLYCPGTKAHLVFIKWEHKRKVACWKFTWFQNVLQWDPGAHFGAGMARKCEERLYLQILQMVRMRIGELNLLYGLVQL